MMRREKRTLSNNVSGKFRSSITFHSEGKTGRDAPSAKLTHEDATASCDVGLFRQGHRVDELPTLAIAFLPVLNPTTVRGRIVCRHVVAALHTCPLRRHVWCWTTHHNKGQGSQESCLAQDDACHFFS